MVSEVIFLLSLSFFVSHADGLYCGEHNCYRVLGVSRRASNAELSQAYRAIARKYHPDRNIEDGAETTYYLAVTAYDTLINDGKRKDYNYMLDSPERVYYHYFQYYNRRFSPNVNIRGFIAVIVIIISIIQYLYRKHSYSEAVRYTMQNPKHRNQYMQVIQQEGILTDNKKKMKNKKSKEEYKREEERVLRNMVENYIEIKGEYSKPRIVDTLLIQVLLSPYYFVSYMKWYIRWLWKFNYLKEEYTCDERIYLTCKGLNFSQKYWEALSESSKEFYLKKELWITENLLKHREEIDDENIEDKIAENGKHKKSK